MIADRETARVAETSEVYRARTIKPKRVRRTKDQLNQLDEQLIALVAEDQPTSVRHTYYCATNPRLPAPVLKTEKGYRHVQGRLVKLRRNGRIPYGWITDATRRGYYTQTYRDEAEFLRQMKSLYRADLWEMSEYYCEVWCESRSIAGVIEDLCRELAVSLYPAGGFTSLSLAYTAAEIINQDSRGRPVVIFYIGDYDQSGVLIDPAIERELRQHLRPGTQLEFTRIGITKEQVQRYNLPTKPRKETDTRSPEVLWTVEAEAMPAHILRDLLRRHIESLLPEQALRVAQVEEESVRSWFDTIANLVEDGDG